MSTMFIARRGFCKFTDTAKAAHAAVAPARNSKDHQSVARSSPAAVKQDLKVTRLPNDLLVASEDSGFPLARISVAVKAGARHEPAELPGLSHALRNAVPLATKQCSAFGLSRNLEQIGASLRAVTTRDLTVYSLECTRENLHDAVKFLSYVVTQQEFKPWEILDSRERMLVDLAILKKHPEIRLVENLHKAAYRGGLGNSLYAPSFAVKHYKGEMLSQFAQRTFQPNRIAISGGNVSHEELLNFAQKYFKFDNMTDKKPENNLDLLTQKTQKTEKTEKNIEKIDGGNINDDKAKYFGGEYFEESIDHLAFAAFVTEGAGLNQPKDLLTAKLLQNILGTQPSIKWSTGQNTSALAKAAAEVTQNDFAVSAVSFCHSDSSLFGFSVVSHAKDLQAILQAGVAVLNGKSGVDQKRLQAAKNRLISCILMAHESSADAVMDAAVQALASGDILSASDACRIVEQINLDDIIGLAKKTVSGKPTLAAVGNLSHCPRLDELIAH